VSTVRKLGWRIGGSSDPSGPIVSVEANLAKLAAG